MLLKFTACLLQAAGGDMGKIKAKGELRIPLIIAPKPSTSSPRPKFREKAQFKRTICTRNKPRYATFIRLRARYKFASANSVQQC